MTMKPGTKLFWHDHSYVHPVEVVERPDALPAELYKGTVDVKYCYEGPTFLSTQTVRETDLFASELEAFKAAQAWLENQAAYVAYYLERATKKAA